jgi:antitoxin ParD1/3/4
MNMKRNELMTAHHRKTVALTAKDDCFIADQIASGEYGNVSEVIRAGLRLLEQEQLRLKALRQAIAEGDADVAAGRVKTYQPGVLVREFHSTARRKG